VIGEGVVLGIATPENDFELTQELPTSPPTPMHVQTAKEQTTASQSARQIAGEVLGAQLLCDTCAVWPYIWIEIILLVLLYGIASFQSRWIMGGIVLFLHIVRWWWSGCIFAWYWWIFAPGPWWCRYLTIFLFILGLLLRKAILWIKRYLQNKDSRS
jgi:hypothetical protein